MTLDINKKYFVFAPDGEFREISTLSQLYRDLFETELLPTYYRGSQTDAEGAIWKKECEGVEFFATDMKKQDLIKLWLVAYAPFSYPVYDFSKPPKADKHAAEWEIDKAIKTLKAGLWRPAN